MSSRVDPLNTIWRTAIPAELWKIIVRDLSKADLLNLCVSSKSWYTLFIPLYFESLHCLNKGSWEECKAAANRAKGTSRTDFRQLVKKLVVHGTGNQRLSRLSNVIQHFSNMVTLELCKLSLNDDDIWIIATKFRHLSTLSFQADKQVISDQSLLIIASQCKALAHLSIICSDPGIFSGHGMAELALLPPLTSFSMVFKSKELYFNNSYVYEIDEVVIFSSFLRGHARLCHLTIHWPFGMHEAIQTASNLLRDLVTLDLADMINGKDLVALISNNIGLRKLSLHKVSLDIEALIPVFKFRALNLLDNLKFSGVCSSNGILLLLESLPRIRRLHFSLTTTMAFKVAFDQEKISVLSSLCPLLESVHIEIRNDTWLKLIADQCPRLVTLEILGEDSEVSAKGIIHCIGVN